MLLRPRLMTIAATYNVHMLLANGLIKQAGCQSLVGSNGFMTYRAYAGYAWFTFWVAVGAALNCHKLIRNFHGAVDFGNKLLAHKKFGLAYGAFYRLHV